MFKCSVKNENLHMEINTTPMQVFLWRLYFLGIAPIFKVHSVFLR